MHETLADEGAGYGSRWSPIFAEVPDVSGVRRVPSDVGWAMSCCDRLVGIE
jgi:hypothetical protein